MIENKYDPHSNGALSKNIKELNNDPTKILLGDWDYRETLRGYIDDLMNAIPMHLVKDKRQIELLDKARAIEDYLEFLDTIENSRKVVKL